MKNKNSVYGNGSAFAVFFLAAMSALLAGGCGQIFDAIPEEGTGALFVAIGGSEGIPDAANRSALAPARTVLATDAAFTGYELYVSRNPDGTGADVYSSARGSFQIALDAGTYYVAAAGFTGDKPVARTWDGPAKSDVWTTVDIPRDGSSTVTLALSPYMYEDVYGTLQYSLSWSDVGQIPARADLLVEQYNSADESWNPIPVSLMNENVTAGASQGMITLLRRETGLVQQSGSLSLPPGEYRLTTTVVMDSPYPPVSRTDIAHVFSNLTTPAAFVYGSGDLIVTNPGTDTGSGFITAFNFKETPDAVSVIGSNPGPDGTRLIMVMVPPGGADLTRLTPVVECAEGARITSPAPSYGPDGKPFWDAGDYSKPSSWTATGLNGVTQRYMVVVTKPADDECMITNIAFVETVLTQLPDIVQPTNEDKTNGAINVIVPNGTKERYPNYDLTPVVSWIGKEITLIDGGSEIPWPDGTVRFGNVSPLSRQFKVYAQNGSSKVYTVTITEAESGDAEITEFFLDGYPACPGKIIQPSGDPLSEGTITVILPYGTPIGNFTPVITYKGNLSPDSGVEQNFSAPVDYTVKSGDTLLTKTYTVTVYAEGPSTDTGIFDMVIVNVPKAKVVIGTKARPDGKIPVVVQVPYKTSPLTADKSMTDLKALIPRITLSSSTSALSPAADGAKDVLPFNNQNDYQEAVYRVTAQAGNYQDYVVVVARDVQYYYVKAAGDDKDPDQFNGGSESTPFRTLAYAVQQSVKHNVDHIYVIGTLNDASEGGAYEDTSTTDADGESTFSETGGASISNGGGASVFNLKGAGLDGGAPRRIYITGVGSNAVLQGAAGKRVISITGGAHITFENITIRDGASSTGNGGGLYIGGGSTVIWKNGVISGNTAVSGGGVYADNSEFQLLDGSVNDNTASGSAVTRADFEKNVITDASITGGGGVYVYGENSLFWLAEGTISGNKTSGSGGGVLVNGSTIPNRPNPDKSDTPLNFMMSKGEIKGNMSFASGGGAWPHGGGGVYVAKGVFEMLNGHITGNNSKRQGGGVFVWSRALFDMYGESSVTGNIGTGSSLAIGTRGITTMRGNAQADKVYVWNYAKGSWNNGAGDEFTMMEGARAGDVELGFAEAPINNRNYINILGSSGSFSGSGGPIARIGLESRLDGNDFDHNATIDGDWTGTYLIKNGGSPIDAAVLQRFPLINFFRGTIETIPLTGYKLDSTGKLVIKK